MTHLNHDHEHAPAAALAVALSDCEADLERGRADLAAQRAQLQHARSQLKSERAHSHDLAWELEDLEQRLRDISARPAGAVALLHDGDLARLNERRAALEEQALKQLILLDELAARCADDDRALAERERAWTTREAQLVAECARLRALLEQ